MADAIEHFVSAGIHGILRDDCRVFESWYFDEKSQRWTQTHPGPGARCCAYKSVEYWVVDGVRTAAQRALVPYGLSLAICKAIESTL